MSLSKTALERLESHWAVAALDATELARGLEIAQPRLVSNALGRQLRLAWDERPGDEDLLRRLGMAYEMAAIEGVPALVNLSPAQDQLRERKPAKPSIEIS